MSKPKPTTFTLRPGTVRDIPRLGEISTRAFDLDAHSQMKIAAQGGPKDFADGMVQEARYRVEAAPHRCAVVKAVDDRDGRTIAGLIYWGWRGEGVALDDMRSMAEAEESHPILAPEEKTVAESSKDDEEAKEVTSADQEPGLAEADTSARDRVTALNAMTTAHMVEFMDKTMPEGTRCLYIAGISVDPAYQGQGLGSQLIRWGTEQADRLGVFCWVHASEAGWPVFVRHGFEEVDRLEVDLDEWAAGPPATGGNWGKYVFRYLVRQPVRT